MLYVMQFEVFSMGDGQIAYNSHWATKKLQFTRQAHENTTSRISGELCLPKFIRMITNL